MKTLPPEIKVNSKEEVDFAINSFKNLINKKNLTPEEVKEYFFELFGSFFHLYQYFQKDVLKALPIYRARPAESITDKSIWRNYGAPPKNKNCGIGRANLACKNVFYGNSNPLGALLETKQVNKGNEFYLGRWVFKDDVFEDNEIAISTFIDSNTDDNGVWNVLTPSLKESYDFFLRVYGIEKAEIVQYLFLELGKLFSIKGEEYYKITAFLADQVIYNPKENDSRFPRLLLYPSVIDGNFLNIAIHPDFADKFFRLEKVIKIRVIDKVDSGVKVLPEFFGLIENDILRFFERNISLNNRQFKIEKLKCACGIEIEFDDPERLLLRRKDDNSDINLREICYSILSENFSHSNYEDVLDNTFEKDGFVATINQSASLKIENYELDYGGKSHDVFIADCVIVQPIQYRIIE